MTQITHNENGTTSITLDTGEKVVLPTADYRRFKKSHEPWKVRRHQKRVAALLAKMPHSGRKRQAQGTVTANHRPDDTTQFVLDGSAVVIETKHWQVILDSEYRWKVVRGKVERTVYDKTTKKSQRQFLHDLVMNAQAGQRVYARDGNFLNCTVCNFSFEKNPVDPNRPIDPELIQWLEQIAYRRPDGMHSEFRSFLEKWWPTFRDDSWLASDVISEALTSIVLQLKRPGGKSRSDFKDRAEFQGWCFTILRATAKRRSHQLGDVDRLDMPDDIALVPLDDVDPESLTS